MLSTRVKIYFFAVTIYLIYLFCFLGENHNESRYKQDRGAKQAILFVWLSEKTMSHKKRMVSFILFNGPSFHCEYIFTRN